MTSTVLRSSPVDHSYLADRTFPSSYDGSTAPHCTQRTDLAKRLLYTTRHLNLTLAFTGREHTTKRQEKHQHRAATRHCDLSKLPYVMQSNSLERYPVHPQHGSGFCKYLYQYNNNNNNKIIIMLIMELASKYRLRATHVAIIKNMKQDVLTWRSLSTAEYRVHPVVLLHTLRVLLANDFCGSFRT